VPNPRTKRQQNYSAASIWVGETSLGYDLTNIGRVEGVKFTKTKEARAYEAHSQLEAKLWFYRESL
jgi:hypothetical protein